MPLLEIQPGSFRKILYGFPRGKKIAISIEATGAVDVYIVPESEYEKWRNGKSFSGEALFRKKALGIEMKVDRDFQGGWYLVIENRLDKLVTVHYEVLDI